jgi:hypothetical protein
MTDCHAFPSGSFSMNSRPLQPASSSVAIAIAGLSGTRWGSRTAGAIAPRFRRKSKTTGRRHAVLPSSARVVWMGRIVGLSMAAGRGGPVRLRQGDQSNFGAVPASETASPQLVRCGYETSSKAAFPWGSKRSTDPHCCSTEETKKREFQRQSRISATYSSRGQESAGDRSTSSSMRAS